MATVSDVNIPDSAKNDVRDCLAGSILGGIAGAVATKNSVGTAAGASVGCTLEVGVVIPAVKYIYHEILGGEHPTAQELPTLRHIPARPKLEKAGITQ